MDIGKEQFIEYLAEKFGLTKSITGEVLTSFLEHVVEEVAAGNTVKFVNFGSFKAVTRKARKGHNPVTNAPIEIPEKVVPKFQAGVGFKKAVLGG